MDLLNKQNDIKSLKVQATARLFYNKADTIDTIQWAIVILLPLLKFFFLQSVIVNYILIIWFFVSFILDYYIDKYTDTGAELKKNFDYYVYGWTAEMSKKLLHVSEICTAKNKDFFENQISNSGTDKQKGVKDWYTTVSKDMSPNEAIKSAMQENIYFDKKINNSAYWCIIFFVGFLLLALSISGLTFYEVLFGLFVTFASFTKKLYSTLVNIKKVSIINNNIEN
ncbi:hypothetical protein RI77_11560, partial [Listeria monocytogenes]|nr:hypothetical protein [Listeria monocytogenes]HCE1181209.1 hypothetical protein [Listeria innocua]HDM9215726.1 hypothetical protein [Listeria innocua]